LLDQLVAASQAPKFADVVHDLAIDDFDDDDLDDELSNFVRKPWRKLRRTVDALEPDSPDHELHLARIAAKRCRYAAEAVAPALGNEVRAFAKAITDLQDVLGEHQDAVVAGEWLRENRDGAGFVAGELAATEHFAAMEARAQWPEVWKRAKRKKLRRWM
jgi:CHAD domain-containing protein